MTKTPLEEFLESLDASVVAVMHVDTDAMPVSRADMIKSLWNRAILDAPPDALTGEDGLVVSMPDPHNPGERIAYEIITYGTKRVVEAEGVVVCHLLA